MKNIISFSIPQSNNEKKKKKNLKKKKIVWKMQKKNFNPLSAKSTKWSNTIKQFVNKLQINLCTTWHSKTLSVNQLNYK